MKTLDEVIDQLIDCHTNWARWSQTSDIVDRSAVEDAIEYLKEYRSDKAMWEADRKGYLNWIEQYKEAREKHQQAVIELKKNPPLTWDELKTMKGKPVWVELRYREGGYSHWGIIEGFPKAGYEFMGLRGFHQIDSFYLMAKEMGVTWQAYRKERE